MPGHSTLFPPGESRDTPRRPGRDLVAVLYRHAGLIALCALAGAAASLLLSMHQPRVDVSGAKVRVKTAQLVAPSLLPGIAPYRETSDADTVDRQTGIAQARDDLRQSEDRIVALLVRDGGGAGRGANAAADGGLRLDLDPDAAVAGGGATPVADALQARSREPQLRLDEARQVATEDAGNLHAQLAGPHQRVAGGARENTPLEAELDRLERARQLAQQRFVDLRRKLDQTDLTLRLNPTEAGRRVIVDAPGRPALAEDSKKIFALLGPVAGLLLGLWLAARRELGGDRMRSPREAEWALGVPVLGAIPTLSAKARNACLEPPVGPLTAIATEFA